MLKYCWKRLRFIWWKMFKDVQRKLKELSHLRWNSLKTWSISLQKFHLWTYFNIFTGWNALKDGNYFNVFNIISTDLFQHYFNSIISTNMSFNVFQHIYFNLFQRYFNIYFNVFTGWKPLKDEIYFNIISTYLIRRVHWWKDVVDNLSSSKGIIRSCILLANSMSSSNERGRGIEHPKWSHSHGDLVYTRLLRKIFRRGVTCMLVVDRCARRSELRPDVSYTSFAVGARLRRSV